MSAFGTALVVAPSCVAYTHTPGVYAQSTTACRVEDRHTAGLSLTSPAARFHVCGCFDARTCFASLWVWVTAGDFVSNVGSAWHVVVAWRTGTSPPSRLPVTGTSALACRYHMCRSPSRG